MQCGHGQSAGCFVQVPDDRSKFLVIGKILVMQMIGKNYSAILVVGVARFLLVIIIPGLSEVDYFRTSLARMVGLNLKVVHVGRWREVSDEAEDMKVDTT